MLGDLADTVGGGLLRELRRDRSQWLEYVLTHQCEMVNGRRRDAHPMPVLRRAVEYRPERRETAALAGQSADDLHSTPRLAEGAFDEIGVPDPLRLPFQDLSVIY